MFFMFGTWPGEKELGEHQGYRVFMTYQSVIIFFIPILKFGKSYFAEKNGITYELSEDVGRRIEQGENVNLDWVISPSDEVWQRGRVCPNCGYAAEDASFTYCPRCGSKLS